MFAQLVVVLSLLAFVTSGIALETKTLNKALRDASLVKSEKHFLFSYVEGVADYIQRALVGFDKYLIL